MISMIEILDVHIYLLNNMILLLLINEYYHVNMPYYSNENFL